MGCRSIRMMISCDSVTTIVLEGVSGPLKVIGAGDEEVAEIGRIAVEIENAEAAPGKAW